MLTYRVRPRIFKFALGTKITTPATAEVCFHLSPGQPFGVEKGGGRTAVRSVDALVQFDVYTGQHTIESAAPLSPLALEIIDANTRISVDGSTITVRRTVRTQLALTELVESIYYVLPLLLAAEFADPPVIREVSGRVNGHPFSWHLEQWKGDFHTTTQEKQHQRVRDAWRRLQLLAAPEHWGLLAALHYFHVATRLERVAVFPGEFLAEALLNYSKVLEVLFANSTDTAREELSALGFTREQVERDYIPAMIVRSQIDVAHVSLSLFTPAQLSTLHRFAGRCEAAIRELIERLLAQLDAGTLTLRPYELHGADARVMQTIAMIDSALASLGDKP